MCCFNIGNLVFVSCHKSKKKLQENSENSIKTILQVFKDNPAFKLYKRLGFEVYEETETHYRMEKI